MKKIEKILELLEREGITVSEFERLSGLSNSYLANTLSRDSDISEKMIEKVKLHSPDNYKIIEKALNIYDESNSTQSGYGNNRKTSSIKEIQIERDSDLELIKKIDDTEFRYIDEEHMLVICPFIEQNAYAGYLAGFSDPSYSGLLPKAVFTLDELKFGVYRAFQVKGDSMDNGLKGCYSSGDVVFAKVLQRKYYKDKLQIGRHPDWIIVSKTEGIIIKQIIDHDLKTGIITYHSLNPDYKDGQIHIDDVYELLYVVSPKPVRR